MLFQQSCLPWFGKCNLIHQVATRTPAIGYRAFTTSISRQSNGRSLKPLLRHPPSDHWREQLGISRVPDTNRWRVNLLSHKSMKKAVDPLANIPRRERLSAYTLPEDHGLTQLVRNINQDLAKANGFEVGSFKINIIYCPDVFFATLAFDQFWLSTKALMDFGTESSIALLLAQHLVKDLARHAAEIYTIHKLSLSLSTRSRFFHGYLIQRSRNEADYLCLVMLARAGYEPSGAIDCAERSTREQLALISKQYAQRGKKVSFRGSAERFPTMRKWVPEIQERLGLEKLGTKGTNKKNLPRLIRQSLAGLTKLPSGQKSREMLEELKLPNHF